MKWLRYSAASIAGAATSQICLLVFLVLLDVDPVPANVIAVTAGAVPNYLINRAWTFAKRGRHSFWGEVAPFWGMTLLGLVLSTLAVAAVERAGWQPEWLWVSGANIGAFGALWFVKYLVLEHVLFAQPHGPQHSETDALRSSISAE